MGTAAGFLGGWVDNLFMRAIDVLMAFPTMLLALGLVATIGPGLVGVMLAVGIASVPRFARVVRASVLSVKENEYVMAARGVGQRELLVLFRHVLPNCLAPIVVLSTLLIADAILISSGLGFLGLGVQPPHAEWGVMLSDGRAYLRVAPHVATFPGLAIMFTVLGFNLLGDGLRDALDVRLTK
jgi:peptide/nickel transport system permease protein